MELLMDYILLIVLFLAVLRIDETLFAIEDEILNINPPATITSTNRAPIMSIISALICAFSSINIVHIFNIYYTLALTALISWEALMLAPLLKYALYINSAAIAITITPPNKSIYSAAPCPPSSFIISMVITSY